MLTYPAQRALTIVLMISRLVLVLQYLQALYFTRQDIHQTDSLGG